MTDFKKLKVWQKAHVMALNAHRVAGHLLAARDLAAVRASDSLSLISQVIEVRKMLYGLLRYLKHRPEDKSEAPQRAATQA